MASTEILEQNLQVGYIWSARAILGVCNHADIEAITHAIEVYWIGKTDHVYFVHPSTNILVDILTDVSAEC